MRPFAIIASLLASAVLVGLGVRSFHDETALTRPLVLPFEIFWCAEDDDCTIVDRVGCCSCTEGGAQASVTAWRTDDLRRFLKHACEPQQVCVQVDLCRRDLRPRCVKRQCASVVADGE